MEDIFWVAKSSNIYLGFLKFLIFFFWGGGGGGGGGFCPTLCTDGCTHR